jgi:alkylation response protein AidB-like acyl-CoA dehydrogenase
MNFDLTDEQRMTAETLRTLLAAECTPARLRRQLAEGLARDPARWRRLTDLGLLGALAPEDQGGLGLQAIDLIAAAEACGYFALPEPLVEQAGVVVPLLAEVETPLTAAWLPRVIRGEATVAIGHPSNPLVSDADTAGALVLVHGGELHLIEQAEAALVRQQSVDPFRRLFRVDWTPRAETRIAEGAQAAAALDRALDRGALFAAAQLLGLAQRSVDLAAAYAKERVQFGRPIGSYQAVKHLLANVQVKIEFARPVAQAAAAQIDNDDQFAKARISHAKLAAGEAADLAARTAVQVHGAMGYSWEVDVHFFLKRALALTHAWGAPAFHRQRVIGRIRRGPLGPDQTFATALSESETLNA